MTVVIAVGVFAVVIAMMAVGVIMGRKPLQGSCGGLNNLSEKNGDAYCEICGANGKTKDFCD